jgi:hypothetical protein
MKSFLKLITKATRQYIQSREWRAIRSYGSAQAKELNLKPSDVPRLIKEFRREQVK